MDMYIYIRIYTHIYIHIDKATNPRKEKKMRMVLRPYFLALSNFAASPKGNQTWPVGNVNGCIMNIHYDGSILS